MFIADTLGRFSVAHLLNVRLLIVHRYGVILQVEVSPRVLTSGFQKFRGKGFFHSGFCY